MDKKEVVIVEKAYLYSLWKDDKLHVYEGIVRKTSYSYNFAREPECRIHYRFILDKKQIVSSRQRIAYDCSGEEGEIFNKVVWFTEPDEQRAKDIFIRYERFQIEELQEKIDKHQKLIELLES